MSTHEMADPNTKTELDHSEGSAAPEIAGLGVVDRVVNVSDADNRRILRRTDLHLMLGLTWIYYLQLADKTIVGLTAIYGLKTDAHLVGNQYSNIGSIGFYAQLAALPIATVCLVKVPYRWFLTIIVALWAVSVYGLSASRSYGGLMANRFLLGFFEAACIPLYSVLVIAWYRRAEQPFRQATWLSMNGGANVLCSPIVYGLARIHSDTLHTYQIVYLFFASVTIITAVTIPFWMANTPADAKFFTPEDRLKAVERLKANQQGIIAHNFNWAHVKEVFMESKFYLFMLMSFSTGVGANTSNVFGPTILQQVVGFTADHAVLLNIPFGVVVMLNCFGAAYLAKRFKRKGVFMLIFLLPAIVGAGLLYGLKQTKPNQGPLLLGYYLFGSLYATLPLLITWIGSNIAGQTKKSTYYTAWNFSNSIGNIAAPYLFQAKYAPLYHQSLEGIFVIFAVYLLLVILQILNLKRLQRKKERTRVAAGLPEKIEDYSMSSRFQNVGAEAHGQAGLEDATDVQNPWFTYVV